MFLKDKYQNNRVRNKRPRFEGNWHAVLISKGLTRYYEVYTPFGVVRVMGSLLLLLSLMTFPCHTNQLVFIEAEEGNNDEDPRLFILNR